MTKKNIKTPQLNTAYLIGENIIGPYVYEVCEWILKELKSKGINTLFFLSRDGRIFYDAMQQFSLDFNIQFKYLLCSRKVIGDFNISSFIDYQDYLKDIAPSLKDLAFFEILEYLTGELVPDHKMQQWMNDRKVVADGYLVDDCLEDFLANFSQDMYFYFINNRRAYKKYLEQEFYNAGKVAIFDIGYKGTAQRFLMGLFEQSILGLYLGTFDEARNNIGNENLIQSFSFHLKSREEVPYGFISHVFLYETFFSDSIGSFLGINRLSSKRLYSNEGEKKYQTLFDIHSGVLDCISKISSGHQYVGEKSATIKEIERLVFFPTYNESIVFKGLPFFYCIGKSKDILQEIGIKESIWFEGAKVILFHDQPIIGRIVYFLRYIEKKMVYFISNKRLFNKYIRNRKLFFLESKFVFLKFYYKFIGSKY